MLVSLRSAAFDAPVISTSSALRDYLHLEMSNDNRERFRTLYLNARNELLLDEEIAGTVDVAPFYPREIIGRAIEIGATSLIIVHNHPSGDPAPSSRDVAVTVAFGDTCRGVGLALLDHIIIARNGVVSFRARGLLDT